MKRKQHSVSVHNRWSRTVSVAFVAVLVWTAVFSYAFIPGNQGNAAVSMSTNMAYSDNGIGEETGQNADAAIAAEDRVVVLYEDGGIPSEAIESYVNKETSAPGTISAQEAVLESAQSEILDEALGSSLDYTIEDTIVLEAPDKEADSMVVGVVSSEESSAGELAKTLSQSEGIKLAEPDYRYHICDMPAWNDTYINDSWQLGDSGVNADKAPAPSADFVKDPVVVAVMDTGIDYDHPDLAGRMWTEPKTGYSLKGKHGVDFSSGDSDPMDENGHGTHCAGIIAAAADNAKGIAGIAGKSDAIQLMAVRILDEEGSGYLTDIVKGFKYLIRAKREGVNIRAVNCSFGASSTSDIFDEVIEQAGQNGILTIAAAGNESSNNDTAIVSPANAKSDYTVVVAALDENGDPASYSNYGSKLVDIAAPGSNILSSVSYYNYAPYLYDAVTISKTTQTYGEFSGSSTTPMAGTAYNGDSVSGVETFGAPKTYSSRVSGSKGSTSLSLTTENGFAVGNNNTSLRWSINGAKAGDEYVLYFPYEKRKGSPAMNIVCRTHCEGDADAYAGDIGIGDVKVTDVDRDGNASWSSSSEESEIALFVSPAYNSIWRGSGMDGALYDRGDIAGLDEGMYGLGFTFTAYVDGDSYIDISSLAVAKASANEEDFGKYDVYSGTSMATPAVTAAAGILAAADPDMDAETLKAAILATTKADSRLKGICTTGSRLDFSEYSAATAAMKPAISSVTADFKAKTVTIKGRGFGDGSTVKAFMNATDKDGKVIESEIKLDPSDIEIGGSGTIIISNAGSSGYGLIGREIRFEISSGGRSAESTFYIVKGLEPYSDEYRTKLEEEDEFWFWKDSASGEETAKAENGKNAEETGGKTVSNNTGEQIENPIMPAGLSFVSGANKLYKYNSDGDIYQIASAGGLLSIIPRGETALDALTKYSKTVSGKVDYWIPDYEGDEEELGYSLIGSPAYLGDVIYELIKVDMIDRDAYVLMGLDLHNYKWKIYYDSLAGRGSKPEELNFREIDKAVLAAYNGRLWLLGCGNNEVFDDENESYSVGTSKEFFSCYPNPSGTKWRYEGTMPEARTNGRALSQGGRLWYFLSNDSKGKIDYNVYSFNGSSWKVAGELPKALFADTELITEIDGFWMETYEGADTILCATGIDRKGLIFAGKSFDGPGDTFRFNTTTCKAEPLKYSLWQTVSDRQVDGAAAGGKFYVEYERSVSHEVIGKSFPIKSGYVTLKKSVKGKGTVIGGGSYARGETATITIKPAKGYYIAKISSKGFSPSLNKTYKKANAASKKTRIAKFKATKNGKISVQFKKIEKKGKKK